MIYLSVLSLSAAVLYLHIGFTAFHSNKKSKLFRLFLLITISLAIWSFANGFIYLADNVEEYSFWNKAGAFGWCTFEALVLYFVLEFTGNRYIKYWFVKAVVVAPAPIFLFMVLFLFGPNIKTSPLIENIFYTGNFLYNFTYLAICILLISIWGAKSKSKIHKKQASIIALSSGIPFLLNFVHEKVFPYLGISNTPGMGQIFTVIMILGVNLAITKYQFMSIPTAQITYELFNELSGLTFLLDSEGFIMKANRQVYTLFDYHDGELIGKHINDIIKNNVLTKVMTDCESITERVRLWDVYVELKSGKSIPFHLSIVPLRSQSNLLRGILLIGEDIRATKWLQDEIEKHKKTNVKYKNSEMLFRKLLEITPISIMLISRRTGCIVYLNTQAVELLGAGGAELIGSKASDYFMNQDDLNFLRESFHNKKKVSKTEVELRRRDGSVFIGLLTMVDSIYHEEEVALSCVVDMTDQKSVEETLKRNNDYIKELNTELMIMNNNLMLKSIRDGLTNLYNHQYINEILEEKLQKASVSNENLCIMMMDIDHFKKVNDRFGHMIGDHVLSVIADLIVANTSDNHCIGRYGGEEFIAIMPNTSMDEAIVIAENVRCSIQEHDFGRDDLKVTISIGLVQYLDETPNMLINKADLLLYQAKRYGRNRVENQVKDELEYSFDCGL